MEKQPDKAFGGATIESVISDFEVLDEWEDRYRYLIDLGRKLPPFPEAARTDDNKVKGCVSQVWLLPHLSDDNPPKLYFDGDSDAHIVKGLVALMMLLFNGKTLAEAAKVDAKEVLEKLGLAKHLSPMRTNGLYSMVGRIREIAEQTA